MNVPNLSAVAVRERAITLFLIIAISAAGLFAFFKIGRAEDPAFTVKTFTAVAVWPGATAQEMQDQVAEPLEKRVQELAHYDRVETFTRPGLVFMTVTLKDTTPPAAVPEQFYQARKKLSDETPRLPRGVMGPFVNDEYSDVTFALYAIKAPGMPLRDLARVAETQRQRLLHVPGVQKVTLIGEQAERIYVEFNHPRLATLGVQARDILAALARQNAVTPAGSIDTVGQHVFVRLDGAYDDLQKISDTPIAAGGRTLKLSDVADVKRGYEDPATFVIRNNGEEAIVLGVVMRLGWNGLELGKALEAERDKIAGEMPLGMTFSKITDQAVNINEAVGEFSVKFFVALAVVMVVSLVSLGWRVGIVVAAAVPLTLAIVLIVMLGTDRVFDRITLGAMILALGLLVDDAIISIETMVVKMEEGWDRIKAAGYAWSHTAAPMLSGTLVTVIGLMPVGFARSSAGEYAGNIFWIVGFALIASWFVAVVFTPYMGVKLLPNFKKVEGGHAAMYDTPNFRRLRQLVQWSVRRKFAVAGIVVAIFVVSVFGLTHIKQQFFPSSDRPEVLVEVTLPQGTAIEVTQAATAKVEAWVKLQPETQVYSSYVGQGAPRFFFSYNPELPNPNFAKMIVLTKDEAARDRLKTRLRDSIAAGLVPEARVRVSQLVFGPYTPYPVMFRVSGPDVSRLREIADRVQGVMRASPNLRTVHADWGERVLAARFVLDQDRLRLIGLNPNDAAEQLQFLLTGVATTQVRENIRTVDVVARSAGGDRLDPAKLEAFTLTSKDGKPVPLSQIGTLEYIPEEPILKRRDRTPTITVQGDIAADTEPPQVSMEVLKSLKPIIDALPPGYGIDTGGSIEEAVKANSALGKIFPIMIVLTMAVIVVQVRSLAGMFMVLLTAPLGLPGAVPVLLLFGQPFGFNAILGLIGLAGILMRNTLILIGQIHTNADEGLDPYHAIVEATVQRARPVILTALAAVLAFVPLTFSVFWGSMAYTLIGGTAVGTVLTLLFLPALYAIWFRVTPTPDAPAPRPEAAR